MYVRLTMVVCPSRKSTQDQPDQSLSNEATSTHVNNLPPTALRYVDLEAYRPSRAPQKGVLFV